MQKVVGSNPISRFEEGLQSAGFLASGGGKGVCLGCQGIAKRLLLRQFVRSKKAPVCRVIPLV
jgi:hypothetical protein